MHFLPTTVGVCLLFLSAWFSGNCFAKTFQLAVSGGTVLCAASPASQTTSVNELPGGRIPPQVRCAQRCTSHAPCHSFNYRSDHLACQFYHYPPTVCQVTPNCEHFQVKTSIVLSIKLKLKYRCHATTVGETTSCSPPFSLDLVEVIHYCSSPECTKSDDKIEKFSGIINPPIHLATTQQYINSAIWR